MTTSTPEAFVQSFQQLEQKLRKRMIIIKPNYKEADQQYRELLRDIRKYERDHHQGGRSEARLRYYSAFCNLSLAKCEQALRNTSGEASSLLAAGREYIDEHVDIEERGIPNMDECYHIGLQCFHLCVDIYLVKKMRALAACVYVELASVLQIMGKSQEAGLYFRQAVTLQRHSPLSALDSLHSAVACSLTHRDYKEASSLLQTTIDLCFLSISPHRVTDPPSAPIRSSLFTNCIISSRISLILLKVLQRDLQSEDGGGLPNLFVQLVQSKEIVYSHDFCPEPTQTVMLLQDFVKAAQMRHLDFLRILLPSLAPTLTPLQWQICTLIMDDMEVEQQ